MFHCRPITDSQLRRIALTCVAIMTLIQVSLIAHWWDVTQFSDYGEYGRLAYGAYNAGSWYPSRNQLYGLFIFSPGFVNWLYIQLLIFGTLAYNPVFNMLLNLGIMTCVFRIADTFFSHRTAWISIALYSLLYSTWWCVVPMATELPFLFLSLLGIQLSLCRRWSWSMTGGFLFAIANSIRPLAILFLMTSALLVIAKYREKNTHVWLRIFSMLAGTAVGVFLIGTASRISSGHFIFQSSTSGINLVYTANDEAYGGVAASLLNKPDNSCHIENLGTLLYSQKDSIWTARAWKWIGENPGKYLSFIPGKVAGMFVEDSWPDRAVSNTSGSVDAFFHNDMPLSDFITYAANVIVKSFMYYIIILLFLRSLWIHRKDIPTVKGIWLILLATGIAATCIFAVSPRYHYPYMFVIVIWAAYSFTPGSHGIRGKTY